MMEADLVAQFHCATKSASTSMSMELWIIYDGGRLSCTVQVQLCNCADLVAQWSYFYMAVICSTRSIRKHVTQAKTRTLLHF